MRTLTSNQARPLTTITSFLHHTHTSYLTLFLFDGSYRVRRRGAFGLDAVLENSGNTAIVAGYPACVATPIYIRLAWEAQYFQIYAGFCKVIVLKFSAA